MEISSTRRSSSTSVTSSPSGRATGAGGVRVPAGADGLSAMVGIITTAPGVPRCLEPRIPTGLVDNRPDGPVAFGAAYTSGGKAHGSDDWRRGPGLRG